ncbi:MAG: hypothetical protein Q9167_007000 [Letrouitia subvulpina]
MKIAYYRGVLASRLARSDNVPGAMMSVALSREELEARLHGIMKHLEQPRLNVACVNSPRNVTVAGDASQLDHLESILVEDRIFSRRLGVNVAYHSPQMDPVSDEYRGLLQDLQGFQSAPVGPVMISSVTGERVWGSQLRQGDYWARNMTSEVKFLDSIRAIHADSGKRGRNKLDGSHRNTVAVDDILEIGPHATLQRPIRETLQCMFKSREMSYRSVLLRDRCAIDTMLEATGQLWSRGYPVQLGRVNQAALKSTEQGSPMPTTSSPRSAGNSGARLEQRGGSLAEHHQTIRDTMDGTTQGSGSRVPPFNKVDSSQINATVLFPAAGMLVMAAEAVRQLTEARIVAFEIRDTVFHKPLKPSSSPEGVEMEFCMRQGGEDSRRTDSSFEFRLLVFEDGSWAEACHGTIKAEQAQGSTEVDGGKAAEEESRHQRMVHREGSGSCTIGLDVRQLYAHLESCGLEYGPAFQPIQHVRVSMDGEATAEIQSTVRRHASTPQPGLVHPTTLDGIMQTVFAALTKGCTRPIATMVPTRIQRLWIRNDDASSGDGHILHAYAKATPRGYRNVDSFISVLSEEGGNVQMVIERLEIATVASLDGLSKAPMAQSRRCYHPALGPDLGSLTHDQIRQYCGARQHQEHDTDRFYEDLDLLLVAFITHAMKELSGQQPGARQHSFKRYFDWMEMHLRRLGPEEPRELVSRCSPAPEDVALHNDLCRRIADENDQGKLFVEVGLHLPKILKGDIDPLGLLFHGDLVKKFYCDLNERAHCYRQLISYLDALAHQDPSMRILEAGAGTGATTRYILDALAVSRPTGLRRARYAKYDFTDISVSLLEKAREELGDQPGVGFYVFNIEDEPTEQGFKASSYDLVVAANV